MLLQYSLRKSQNKFLSDPVFPCINIRVKEVFWHIVYREGNCQINKKNR